MSGFGVIAAPGAGHARSVELRFSNGVVDRLELDSTMTMEFQDGGILFKTSRGHVEIEPEGLSGWAFSEEPSVPLLNDVVTSAEPGAELPGGPRVAVEGRRVAVCGLGSGSLVMSDGEGRILATSATWEGGVWVSPELSPGVYLLSHGRRCYKVYVR